jgi:hypothetical protein
LFSACFPFSTRTKTGRPVDLNKSAITNASLLQAMPENTDVSGLVSSHFVTAGNDFSDHFVEKCSMDIVEKNTLRWGTKGELWHFNQLCERINFTPKIQGNILSIG